MEFKKYKPNNVLYRVKENETLTIVAQKFNTTLNNLVPISEQELKPGEFVLIKESNQFCHVVKPLETLKDISQKYKVTESDIIKKNNLTNNRLFIGQKLIF